MVFVDCYTTWCGPCKYMTSNVFPQETVGDYFNPNFICLKIDMEKGEGPELVKRYGIRAFPTFLILRPDGSVSVSYTHLKKSSLREISNDLSALRRFFIFYE